ncbi:MAG: putative lipid II flippase FtsW [Oscillospiraceae bacterium]|jgi:cell division protein FtsW|nr:putative lipid II flippase FtsW [Oscillospiraceae bacterium]
MAQLGYQPALSTKRKARRKLFDRRLNSLPGSEPCLRPMDRGVLIALALLLMAGLVTLFSASYYVFQDTDGGAFQKVKQQLAGIGVGAALMFMLSRIDYNLWRKTWVMVGLLAVSAILLALVLVPGIGVSVNGSRRWLRFAGQSFQPSEFAKFAVVLFMANMLTNSGEKILRFFRGIIPPLIVPGIMFLLILEQPNLSTAGSIIIVAVIMIYIAGAKFRHLGLLGALGAAVFAYYAWSEPYRRERLLSFRDPFAKMSDEGYQLSQSLIAFGSGGLFGMGLGQGRQKMAYLPYPESDFIFAVVGEDFGLVGCIVVVALYLAFIFAGMRVALNCQDKFGCLLASGITMMIGIQAFMNMGVVIGLLPTTGLPLPFFSAGGTSVMIFMAAIGILLNISRSNEMVVA